MSFKKICIVLYVAAGVLLQPKIANAQEEEFHMLALDLNNEARAMHHVGPLFLSEELNQLAQMCAQWYVDQGGWFDNPNNIAHMCPFRGDAGENLYQSFSQTMPDEFYVREAMGIWFSEGAKHNFTGDSDPSSGHFTQMVWAASRLLGFGLAGNNGVVVGVAFYTPKGNILTQFQQNVFRA